MQRFKKLPRAKDVESVTKTYIPIDQELNEFLQSFNQAHRKAYGSAASKQDVLLMMVQSALKQAEKDLLSMKQ